MLKVILKTHQTMRDLSSTVWDTLLIKASSPEADSMQKETQTFAEKVRQEGRGHTRGLPFVWAYLDLIKSLQQRGNTVGTRTAQGLSTYWALSETLLSNYLQRGSTKDTAMPERGGAVRATSHWTSSTVEELRQCSKEGGVTMADIVESLGVDLRTRVKFGSERTAVRFSLIKRNKAFQKNYMNVGGQEVVTSGYGASKGRGEYMQWGWLPQKDLN